MNQKHLHTTFRILKFSYIEAFVSRGITVPLSLPLSLSVSHWQNNYANGMRFENWRELGHQQRTTTSFLNGITIQCTQTGGVLRHRISACVGLHTHTLTHRVGRGVAYHIVISSFVHYFMTGLIELVFEMLVAVLIHFACVCVFFY